MASARLFNLDCIRVIANLLIILFHYNVWTEKLLSADLLLVRNYPALGAIGVSLFLILSGASLSLSTNKEFSTLTFYRKRWLAIFPMFYLVYTCFMLLALLSGNYQFSADRSPLAFGLTILGMDGLFASVIPTYYLIGEWFLGCIIILYLLFPLVRRCFTASRDMTLLFCVALVFLLPAYYNLPLPLQYMPLFRLAEFVCGMYILSQMADGNPTGHVRIGLLVLLLALALTLEVQAVAAIRMNIYGILTFICLCYTLRRTGSKRLANAAALLGRLTYPAFLCHHIILKQVIIFTGHLIDSPVANLFVFVLVVIVVYLTAYLFDTILRRVLQFGHAAGSLSVAH